MNKPQRVTILGSTGSVGKSTLSVLDSNRERYQVEALTAGSNISELVDQCEKFSPSTAVIADAKLADVLSEALQDKGLSEIRVEAGNDALQAVAANSQCDTVMSAIVGAAGLIPTLAAIRAGKRVLIANKEPLVMTGSLMLSEANKSGAIVLPIDSEHNAIFQCLPHDQSKCGVKKVHLTASGGPFRGREWDTLANITPDQACAHPNWSMGRKISVDSATMMNKGLELIEASALFDIPAKDVEIVVHPQSIIHSMVEYLDGSFLAQLGAPDMRIPIAHALAWPDRIESGAATLAISDLARLDFQEPDMGNLPCLRLAREAAQAGGAAPAILNAANEIAVEAFLQEKIGFTRIPNVISATLDAIQEPHDLSLESVLQIDNEARRFAGTQLD